MAERRHDRVGGRRELRSGERGARVAARRFRAGAALADLRHHHGQAAVPEGRREADHVGRDRERRGGGRRDRARRRRRRRARLQPRERERHRESSTG